MPDLVEVYTDEQIEQVTELARRIWNQHYPMIIGQSQVDYMVERFQSSEAIRKQIKDGYQYFLIQSGQTLAAPRPQQVQLTDLQALPLQLRNHCSITSIARTRLN